MVLVKMWFGDAEGCGGMRCEVPGLGQGNEEVGRVGRVAGDGLGFAFEGAAMIGSSLAVSAAWPSMTPGSCGSTA